MRALGLIEVMGLVGAIEAADAALKAANVTLLQVTKVGSGIMTVEITGDVGAVTAAVEAGAKSASAITTLRAKHVIPRMDEALINRVVSVNSKASSHSKKKEEKKQVTKEKQKEISTDTTIDSKNIEAEKGRNPLMDDAGDNITSKDTKEINENNDVEKKSSEEVIASPKQESMKETLLKKSNSQLKNMVTDLGIERTQEEIKRMKKQELVELLERHLKKSIEKGENEWN